MFDGGVSKRYIATIGVDYGVKPHTVAGQNMRVNFWDLSGHAEFAEVREEFYRDTQGLVLVFDVSSAASFQALGAFIAEAKAHGYPTGPVPGALCANKCDLRRAVSEAEGRDFAKQHGLGYFETSALTGALVNEVFEYVFAEVTKR
jgi:DnaJ family protein C protein 27